ncbi:MAG: hypothetical protein FJ296_04480 [Planctomycetes bacterium]|nr:hypothetical protein [Planctomycetota bacterium]
MRDRAASAERFRRASRAAERSRREGPWRTRVTLARMNPAGRQQDHAPLPAVAPQPVCLIRPRAGEAFRFSAQSLSLPLGLAYLAAALEHAGHAVHVLDAVGLAPNHRQRYFQGYLVGLPDHELIARLPPDAAVIGLSILFTHEWPAAVRLLAALRRARPAALLVLGGEHVTAMPEFCLLSSVADVAVLGEGEETLVELLSALRAGRPLSEVSGLAFRTGSERDAGGAAGSGCGAGRGGQPLLSAAYLTRPVPPPAPAATPPACASTSRAPASPRPPPAGRRRTGTGPPAAAGHAAPATPRPARPTGGAATSPRCGRWSCPLRARSRAGARRSGATLARRRPGRAASRRQPPTRSRARARPAPRRCRAAVAPRPATRGRPAPRPARRPARP